MEQQTSKVTILLRNLWMLVAAWVIAGLATLPSASAAHGDFSKGFGAAVGHGFRSSSYSSYRSHSHGHSPGLRSGHGSRHYRPRPTRSHIPFSLYRQPSRSSFYWPRQNIYPASVTPTRGIYVVPSSPRLDSSPGYPVRRTIIINPSPFQEAGSAILNLPRDSQHEYDEDDGAALNLDYPKYSPSLPDIDVAQAWEFLKSGQASTALGIFSSWALAEPDNMEHKLGYGLAAALSGDKLTATYALRVVYEKDVTLWMKPIDATLKATLDNLAERYQVPMESGKPSADELFLAGVFCHLRQSPEEGLKLVRRGLDSGDESLSTRNLQKALESEGQTRFGLK